MVASIVAAVVRTKHCKAEPYAEMAKSPTPRAASWRVQSIMRTVISGLRWATLGAVALHVSCSEGASDVLPPVEIGERPSAEPLRSACDFSQPSKQIVLAVADGPFGGKQDLVLVRADGASFVAHSFGADRVTEDRYIYISGIEISVHGDHLLASGPPMGPSS